MRFLEQIPPHIPVVVDEAYLEFSTRAETLRSNEIILKTDRRVIGLRTFSKFYALAGLRIGYGFAAPDTLCLFNRLEPLFVLSPLAERAAVEALGDEEHAVRTLENVKHQSAYIRGRLEEGGLRYITSEIHMMLVECPASQEKVQEAFETQGIFLPKGLIFDRYILFPITLPEQNKRNLDILLSA
jgi:histidinol-phosphate aminotransferase